MSNSLAIAAVTESLRSLLDRRVNAAPAVDPGSDPALAGTQVTTRPPDRARVGGANGNQLNLFLYQTSPNAAWRNLPPQERTRTGERAHPGLALDLHYLLTAYGQDDDAAAILAQRLLGRAMSVLHDHTVLSREEIRDALLGNDLHEQFERIRITPETLPLEELSKLWATFQTQYRISAAYAVTVVLIDSARAASAPLPVLRRGSEDRGVHTVVGAGAQLREIRADVLPETFGVSARLGATLRIVGSNLGGDALRLRFRHPAIPAPSDPPAPTDLVEQPLGPSVGPAPASEERSLVLQGVADDPLALARWAPGLYTATVIERRPDLPAWSSNAVPFALAPVITVTPNAAAAGDVALQLACRPRLRHGQRAQLLFGARQIDIDPAAITTPGDTSQPSTLAVTVAGVAAGTYTVRLRVDGVDSLPLAEPADGRTLATVFDPLQQVVVT